MNDLDQKLNALRDAHRATARYSLYRHRMADNGHSRVKEPLPDHTGLTFAEANTILDRLNKEAREAAGNPTDSWGLTRYNMKLETPLPKRCPPNAADQSKKTVSKNR